MLETLETFLAPAVPRALPFRSSFPDSFPLQITAPAPAKGPESCAGINHVRPVATEVLPEIGGQREKQTNT